MDNSKPIALAWTGASGAQYGLRLLEELLQAGRPVYLLYSSAAQIVMQMEAGIELPSRPQDAQQLLCDHYAVKAEQLQVFGRTQWTAPVASGSNPPQAMVVCPCTTGTLASIAHGISDNLIERAADVMLKERKPLILVVRETPLSTIHLENMLKLSQAGATILPANPGFYFNPGSVDEIVDFMVARVLDHLQVAHSLGQRWGE
ncbi:MAG: flavin prenyltransferase UbiX [Pseudomonadota bacterium]